MSAPASTTKLLTAAAALQTLGPDYRFVTATRRVGRVIYLIGGGYPSILRTASSSAVPPYPTPATLSALAQQSAAALPHQGRYELRLDSSLWTTPALPVGWSNDYLTEGDVTPPAALELDGGRLQPTQLDSPRTPAPITQAGTAFAELLKQDGVKLRRHIAQQRTPTSAVAVTQVSSPPLSDLVQRMLTVSDNDLAEALGRAVARRVHQPATFAGAAAAVTRIVGSLGIPRRLVSLRDTSGLSHSDRLAAAVLTDLLSAVISAAHPALRPIIAGLPVAGLTGTLADRYRAKISRPAAGIARAKTGSLTGVNTLAGLLVDRSGRLLIYALLASHAPSPVRTVNGLDRLVSRLASCGCEA
jgi:D-alanyl-D-alanine carboxypeptidase/D-alanyl-D-alanine-endopeptidase (penicillin-binding protein 4)